MAAFEASSVRKSPVEEALGDRAVADDRARELSVVHGIDQPRIEAAVREILAAIGEDPNRDGLVDTPGRVARAYAEIFAGLHQDPAEHLERVFQQDSKDIVVVSGIDVFSVCEHHLLPFMGTAHVAYIPAGGKVPGLSKVARVVEVFARRPQLQERLTHQVADAMMQHLEADGVLVVVEAEHLCMKMRGVETKQSVMSTRARRGVFETDAVAREEAMRMIPQRQV